MAHDSAHANCDAYECRCPEGPRESTTDVGRCGRCGGDVPARRAGLKVLEHLNRLCEGHEGDLIERIRCHPVDRDALRAEMREMGTRSRGLPVALVPSSRVADLIGIGGVPVIGDETLIDGPVIDWREKPDLDAAIRLIQKHLAPHPTRDMEESQR